MKKFIVQCIEGRRNYDVACILYKENMLELLTTGLYRNRQDFSKSSVISSWYAGLFQYGMLRLFSHAPYKAYIPATRHLARITSKHMGKSQANAVYGYDTASLEIFKVAKTKRFFCALEQCIAPRRAQIEMYRLFEQKYGYSFNKEIQHCEIMGERERKEWSLADTILVPSVYVQNQMLASGIPIKKMQLVPYGFDIQHKYASVEQMIERRMEKKGTFRILFVGNSSLRKGLQDIAIMANKLKTEDLEFRVAGLIDVRNIKRFNIDKISNIKILGKLNKQKLYEEYQNADIFILPSYLEGMAMVVMEALSFGLPVITTEESGSCITSETNGFVCNAGEIDKMTSHIGQLLIDRNLRNQISLSTIPLIQNFNFDNYSKNLITALR
jgi:glycosyltransferase involved in cell wall biosynthesis